MTQDVVLKAVSDLRSAICHHGEQAQRLHFEFRGPGAHVAHICDAQGRDLAIYGPDEHLVTEGSRGYAISSYAAVLGDFVGLDSFSVDRQGLLQAA